MMLDDGTAPRREGGGVNNVAIHTTHRQTLEPRGNVGQSEIQVGERRVPSGTNELLSVPQRCSHASYACRVTSHRRPSRIAGMIRFYNITYTASLPIESLFAISDTLILPLVMFYLFHAGPPR